MTAPGPYDYEVEGGDCLPLYAGLFAGGVSMELAGYSSEIVFTWYDGRQSITLSTADGTLDITDADSPATGEITGVLSKAQTALLPYGKLTKYEWSYTQPNGCKFTFLKGFVNRT